MARGWIVAAFRHRGRQRLAGHDPDAAGAPPAKLGVIAPDAHAYTVFLLSPANLSGARAALLLKSGASSPLALQLRSPEGAPLGQMFTFISSLYFRGKLAYAAAFGRPPPGFESALVISPGEGLRPVDEPVTVERMQAWASVAIDEGNAAFTRPLIEHAEDLERACGATTRFVLLGSVASNKYVRPLTRVFGDHLWFPPDFVGRGDMSRGALMLRAARDGRELGYQPVEGAARHGPRAARLSRLRR